ncbi:MAG TPA: MFS transporter [Nocardioidaceae bacterium]|nr:MFS transporter [Nocardioidaceae bacterium]
MSAPLTRVEAHRRFLVLTAFRWLPVGLLVPVFVLLPLERGLSLSEIGLAASLQGLVVLALELPTGGLADSLGRRRVLLVAGVVGLVSIALFLRAQEPAAFAVAFALQGAYRALDSGPLEAWYVDASLAADPHTPIERGLSASGVVLGVAISAGALASGGLIALGDLGPLDALELPVVVSLVIQVAGLLAVAALMTEVRATTGLRAGLRAAGQAPRAIADGVRLLRGSRVLMAIVAVELFWGFGMAAFEGLFPVRLSEIVGDADLAAAITGPASSAGWLASAAGAACMPWLGRRIGIAPSAALMRVVQGLAVAGMGFFAGVAGVVAAYLACYAIHGASNPAHMTLLHRQVDGPNRATLVSVNSMAAQPAGALGVIVLTSIAEGVSVTWAMYVAAVVLALAAPLYLPAWRQERDRSTKSELVSR